PDRQGAPRSGDTARGTARDGGTHAPSRVRRPAPAGERGGAQRPSRVRNGDAARHGARRLARARRNADRRRDRRRARALDRPRRPLSALTWPLDTAPTERERLRALAALAAEDEPEASALALANGWDRRLHRAVHAFSRPTALRHPLVREYLFERTSFNVTELE